MRDFHHEILTNGDRVEIPDDADDVNAVAIDVGDTTEIHLSYVYD